MEREKRNQVKALSMMLNESVKGFYQLMRTYQDKKRELIAVGPGNSVEAREQNHADIVERFEMARSYLNTLVENVDQGVDFLQGIQKHSRSRLPQLEQLLTTQGKLNILREVEFADGTLKMNRYGQVFLESESKSA